MDPATGGPCQGLRHSIPAMAGLGVVSEVASLDAPDAMFPVTDPFPVHRLGPARGPWAYAAGLMPWLLENLGRFDAVIIHGLWLYHGHAVRKAVAQLKARGLPAGSKLPRVMVMPHGMLDPYFQRAPGRRLKAIRNWIYWKLVESPVVHAADALLFTCAEEMRLAQDTFSPYHPNAQLNIGYGVAEPPSPTPSTKAAFAAACPGLGERPYFLFLSRIHPKKGVELLIRAYVEEARKVEGRKVGGREGGGFAALVIAGPLDSGYAAEMQALAAELVAPLGGLAEIHFPGMLTGEAKWGAFHGCEAFVLPSHQENFGIAVVEALACGKPVLISKQVNIWREIVGTDAGLVDDNTEDGTLRLLGSWLGDPERARQMAGKARGCYAAYFSIEQAARALDQALRGGAAESPGGDPARHSA